MSSIHRLKVWAVKSETNLRGDELVSKAPTVSGGAYNQAINQCDEVIIPVIGRCDEVIIPVIGRYIIK